MQHVVVISRSNMAKGPDGKTSVQKTLEAFLRATHKFSDKQAKIKAMDDDKEDVDDPEKMPENDEEQLAKIFGKCTASKQKKLHVKI